jgi:death-on-curing protein
LYQYNNPDIFELTANYLFHIIKNHPFVDGNKRIGLIAAITFLELNDFPCIYNQEQLYILTIGIADSSIKKDDIALLLKKWLFQNKP